MGTFLQDLKYATRTLLHSPGYTAAALLSLGLGIGVNTAIFTLTNAVFLHPLPVNDPGRILELYTVDHATASSAPNIARTPMSYPNFVDFREQNDVFSGMAGFSQAGETLTGFGEPNQQAAVLVFASYFDVLGGQGVARPTVSTEEHRTPGGEP